MTGQTTLLWDRHPAKLRPMISYAQNFEDVVLRRAFDGQRAGCYVDVGAWHPVRNSVTKYFYDLGWRGINIEPQPDCHQLLCAERPGDDNLQVVISDTNSDRADLTIFPASPAYSSADSATVARLLALGQYGETLQVRSQTLQDVLAERNIFCFDLLKIDVEGAEGAVLRSIDLREIRPRVLVVEVLEPATRVVAALDWEAQLTRAGYERALFDGINCFYAEREEEALLARLRVPANALDNFIPFYLWQRLSSEARAEFEQAGFAA